MHKWICRGLLVIISLHLCAFPGAGNAHAQLWGPGYFLPSAPQDIPASRQQRYKKALLQKPAQDFLRYIEENDLDKDLASIKLNQYIPGVYISLSSAGAEKTVLGRLDQMALSGELHLEDLIRLLGAPNKQVAAFAVLRFAELFHDPQALLSSADVLRAEMIPLLKEKLTGRLAAEEKQPASATQAGQFLEKHLRLQYRNEESVLLQGYILLTLSEIYTTARVIQSDAFTPADHDQIVRKAMNLFTYTSTHYEWWNGPTQERQRAANLATLALIALDGPQGFKRVMDELDRQNTLTRLQTSSPTSWDVSVVHPPDQRTIKTDNLPLIKQSFDALNLTYKDRIKDMTWNESAELGNILVHYINEGSAPVRIFAGALLTDWYARTYQWNPEEKRKQFITDKQANQIATVLKEVYYCPLKQSRKSGKFGLNADEMLEFETQLAQAYLRVRKDPGYITEPGKPVPCMVSESPTINRFALADDLASEAAWFVLSWVVWEKAFMYVGKAGKYAANLSRAMKNASRLPAGQFTANVLRSMKEARVSAALTRELQKNGTEVIRHTVKKGVHRTQNMTKPQVLAPSEKLLGYEVIQRQPGGTLATRRFGPPAPGILGNGSLPGVSSEFYQFKSIADMYSRPFQQMTRAQLLQYRSALATENLLYAGLRGVSENNFETGFLMAKQWMRDESGRLLLQHEPYWLRLGPNSPVQYFTPVGKPIWGTIRLDLLPALQQPGALFTEVCWQANKQLLSWFLRVPVAAETGLTVLDLGTYMLTAPLEQAQTRREELFLYGAPRTPQKGFWGTLLQAHQFSWRHTPYDGAFFKIPLQAGNFVLSQWPGENSFDAWLCNNPYQNLYNHFYSTPVDAQDDENILEAPAADTPPGAPDTEDFYDPSEDDELIEAPDTEEEFDPLY